MGVQLYRPCICIGLMPVGLARYGLATWDCFRKPPGAPGYLSLARVVALAEAVGGADHGFRWTCSVATPALLPANCACGLSMAVRRQLDTMRKACNFAAFEMGSLEGALAPPHREALSVVKATSVHMCVNVKAFTAIAQVCAAAGERGHAGGVAGRLAAGGERR